MNKFLLLPFAFLLASCSTSLYLDPTPTTVKSSDQIAGRTGLWIGDDFRSTIIDILPVGDTNSAHSISLKIGRALANAVESGVESSFENVILLRSSPSAAEIARQHLRIVFRPKLLRVTCDLLNTPVSFQRPYCEATLRISVTLLASDATGHTFYSFDVSGTGLANGYASPSHGDKILAKAAETALQQIADKVAQTLNSSPEVRQSYSDRDALQSNPGIGPLWK